MEVLQPGGKTAIAWKDQQISYDDLLKLVTAFAEKIKSVRDKNVAIFAENRPEWAYAFYSGWKNNNVVIPVDHLCTVEEAAYIINDCRPQVIFYSNATEKVLRETIRKLNYHPQIINLEQMQFNVAELRATSFPELPPEKTAVIIYTSGTTGSPKGVMLSFDNLIANIEAVSRGVPIYHRGQTLLLLLPLHHIFPLLGALLAPLYVGGTVAITPSLDSDDIINTLQKNKVNIIIGVPRFYAMIRQGIMDKIKAGFVTRFLFKLAEKIDSLNFSRKLFKKVQQRFGGHIEFLVSGGAKLDEEVARDLRTLGFEVLEGFGMTESAPMITFTRPGRVKIGSAGEAMTNMEVEINNGEVVARGRNIMQGYYKKPDATKQVIKDGWLYTGDQGFIDKEGFLHITGRIKDIIVPSNGKNINPEEIENKIYTTTDLVTEIGVFLKDDTLQAVIYPNFSILKERQIVNIEETIRQEVIDSYNQQVSSYKKLHKFHIIKEELPKTRLSKIKRFQLADLIKPETQQKTAIEEPQFEEYRIIKNFLEYQSRTGISPDAHFEIDMSMDSLDMVSFQTFLSNTFGIDPQQDLLSRYPTMEKLALYVKDVKNRITVEAVKWAEIFREKVDLTLPKSWFTHNLIKNFYGFVFRIYFRLRGDGVENLPEGPVILAPNHQSFFDGLFVTAFLKNRMMKNTYFYAKEKHIRRKWLKFIANRHNVIIMDINKDLKLSLQKLAEVLKKGRNLIIFPEGTRSHDGSMGNFKKTFAILSRELNVPVVPVAIQGAFEALPRGSKLPRPFKKIRVRFLKPVYPGDHTYDSLTMAVQEQLRTALA